MEHGCFRKGEKWLNNGAVPGMPAI
jgi:hypothetical protein